MPLPETVTAFLEANPPGKRTLPEALRAWLATRLGETIPPDVWDAVALPAHLARQHRRRRRRRRGARQRTRPRRAARATRRSRAAVVRRRRPGRRAARITAMGLRRPAGNADARARRAAITGYPALVDDGDSVSIALSDTREAAEASTRAGVVRLLRIALKDALGPLGKGRARASRRRRCSSRRRFRPIACLRTCSTAVGDRAFVGDDPLPRSEAAFAEQVKRARTRLPAVAEGAFRLLATIAAEHHALTPADRGIAAAQAAACAEVRARRDALVHPGFFRATPWAQLGHLPALPEGARPADRQVRRKPGPRCAARGDRRRMVAPLPRTGWSATARPHRSEPALEGFAGCSRSFRCRSSPRSSRRRFRCHISDWNGRGRTSTAEAGVFCSGGNRIPPVLQ